jgi:exodeoxyribonuclease VII small subunit
MTRQTDARSLGFEEAFQSLQGIVERLEKGNLPLDESVALFELGTELANRCTALLDQAELKIRSLSEGNPQYDSPHQDSPSPSTTSVAETGEGSPADGLWGALAGDGQETLSS